VGENPGEMTTFINNKMDIVASGWVAEKTSEIQKMREIFKKGGLAEMDMLLTYEDYLEKIDDENIRKELKIIKDQEIGHLILFTKIINRIDELYG
jgi:rubrerythrin